MDTHVWGPKGWLYLHTVAQNYTTTNAKNYVLFFTIIEDILPCKWCRLSYKSYVAELPPEPFLNTQKEFSYWFYTIHNKVNDKLRNQGLNDSLDPPFSKIYHKYEKILETGDASPMWFFLHVVAHNFNPKIHSIESYIKFFELVGTTMPYPEIAPLYQKVLRSNPIVDHLDSQRNLSSWVYATHAAINNELNLSVIDYLEIYKKCESIRANCSTRKLNNSPGAVGTCRIPDPKTRCQGVTKRGRQCIRTHNKDSQYCSQHTLFEKSVTKNFSI